MYSIIDINTGEGVGYYQELADAIRDFMTTIQVEKDRLLVILDTESERVVRWAY